jgi:hypothetical protein
MVGAGLGLSWLGLVQVSWDHVLVPCDDPESWNCLPLGPLILWGLVLVSLPMSWVVLRLVGVRPAWRVLAAAVLLYRPAIGLRLGLGSWGLPEVLLPVGTAALFALAAGLTAPGAWFRRTRAALLAALVLYWLLALLLRP